MAELIGVPPQVLPCFAVPPGTVPQCPLGGLAGVVPSNFSYRNIGEQTDQGFELSLNQRIGTNWNWFLNASWQDTPEFSADVDASSQNLPPEWRGNFGLSYDSGPWFWSANVNYQDSAYWADVLNVRGYTDAFGHLLTLSGAADAMVDCDLNPWDAAATRVLAEEAGGVCWVRARDGGAKLDLIFGNPTIVGALGELLVGLE